MADPAQRPVASTLLEEGFRLDRRWYRMTAGVERSKKPDLLLLARVLETAGVPWALVGGLALQVHREEPRTTLDIDVVVPSRARLPRRELVATGFREGGRFAHSDNWRGPEGTPVQFSDDPPLAAGIDNAVTFELEGVPLRVLAPADLLYAKLRAASDPSRRRSKRLQVLADALGLVEDDESLATELSAAERELLDRLG